MAQYTYECPECESQIEVSHKMLDNPTHLCEKCNIVMFRRAPTNTISARPPFDVLYEKMDKKFLDYKARKRKQKKIRS